MKTVEEFIEELKQFDPKAEIIAWSRSADDWVDAYAEGEEFEDDSYCELPENKRKAKTVYIIESSWSWNGKD